MGSGESSNPDLTPPMPVSQAFPHHWVCAMGKHFKLGGVKNGRELVPQ